MTQRTRLKNQIHGLLRRLLIHSHHKLLWTKKGVAWLKAVELPAHERVVVDSQLRQIAAVEQELAKLDETPATLALNEPRVALLMTLPGVNYVVAIACWQPSATSPDSSMATMRQPT